MDSNQSKFSRHKSGAQKRKAAEEKIERVKKLPKITSFLSKPKPPIEKDSTENSSDLGNANIESSDGTIISSTNDDNSHDGNLKENSAESDFFECIRSRTIAKWTVDISRQYSRDI
ncbi:uncharacterized protein LOC126738840 isoform X2 [Anthonomus grandis grandis]|uniref:uncharacterized protein LOC126738840 isoform X2 n=1 Tax=Anthonomus grandis grandis TaxID=2921223 RepID=UPI0021656474|nr:uncharacterized protein LOC126738840 isoform X2 [Anthonomus grandis grandis]